MITELASEGFADQLLMSHDVCQKMQLTSRGGFGYAHIPAHVAALFVALGAPPNLYHRPGVTTPSPPLCWAPAQQTFPPPAAPRTPTRPPPPHAPPHPPT